MGKGPPKQFRRLGGRPLVAYGLELLEGASLVQSVSLVVPKRHVGWARRLFQRPKRFRKLGSVVGGGVTRQDSVVRGLHSLPPGIDAVLVHDGVRPFATRRLVRRLIQALRRHQAVVPVCPIVETVKKLSSRSAVVTQTVSREGLVTVQTPQAFRRSLLERALSRASTDRFVGTDEAMLVERLGVPVGVVPGEPFNIKITTPYDWAWARKVARVWRAP